MDKFLTGNEAVIEGALDAGASFFAGYPITPGTEILENWAKLSTKNDNYQFIQSEDETSAGFNVIGALLAGRRAFTATAGVGDVLMQDPLSMAEAMRLPMVTVIVQRGGPSTGTVIYSQQEVNLACFGGNGEGLRIVYSTSSPQELYDYTYKAFEVAWKYRFPTFILSDGYQSKERSIVKTKIHLRQKFVHPILASGNKPLNIRNCYNFEDQLYANLSKDIEEYRVNANKISQYEYYGERKAEILILAHGIVSLSAKESLDILRSKLNKRVGFFRPITLRPFPKEALSRLVNGNPRILVVESSDGQFARIIKDNLDTCSKIDTLLKPAMVISPNEITQKILKM